MLDVCLLGTGGMMPLPYRFLTGMMCRAEGSSLLVDCGEGMQIAIRKKGWSTKPIDVLCLTHFHADHCSGLPGLLLSMGNAERTEPLTILGPRGVETVVNSLRVIAPELPFEIRFIELTEKREEHVVGPFHIRAFRVNHNVTCYGYSVSLPRAGKFQVEKAKALGLPVQMWGRLQRGETVEFEGRTVTPDAVMGEARKGLKVTYCTDSRPSSGITEEARGADIFICEGMYGEDDQDEKARRYKHMTMRDAARMAKEAQPGELWLTHYSPSLGHPEPFMDAIREIFPRAVAGKDGMTAELRFAEDE